MVKLWFVFCVSLLGFCRHASSIIGQEPNAVPGKVPIVIAPSELNIKAESGGGVFSKVITLETGEVGPSGKLGLRLTPLRTSADYHNDLAPPKLSISPEEFRLPGDGKPIDILVSLELSKDLRYGEFSCHLIVFQTNQSAPETEIRRIPINLKVRDATMWPLVVLAFGVAAGVLSNWYRNMGQAKDEANASIDELDRFLEQQGVPEPFAKKVMALKADAVAAKKIQQLGFSFYYCKGCRQGHTRIQ